MPPSSRAHVLDRLIGAELPDFRTHEELRAFEATPYAERIAAQSTYDALRIDSATRMKNPEQWHLSPMLQCGRRLWLGGNIEGTFDLRPTLAQARRDLAIPFNDIRRRPRCCGNFLFFQPDRIAAGWQRIACERSASDFPGGESGGRAGGPRERQESCLVRRWMPERN